MLHLTIAGLRQQQWRSEAVYDQLRRYALSIGALVIGDDIWATDRAQERQLAWWWSAHA